MTDTTTPPAAPRVAVFDPAWTMVQQAWRWYNDHLRMLLQISFIAAVPSFIYLLVLNFTQHPILGPYNQSLGLTISFGLGFFLWGIFNIFWTMLGTIATYQYLQQPDGAMTAWQRFLGARVHAVNYFSTAIVYGLIIFGGILLLIIPGIIWAVMFSLAPLVVIYEKVSTAEALSRSKDLMKGHWFDVFWRGLLLGLTVIGISIVAGIIFGIISRNGQLTLVSDLLDMFLNTLLTPVPLIMTFMIYTKLTAKA